MRLALAGGVPDMPDLPDMMSGNLKRMTLQDGRPGLSHAAASAPAWRPEAGQDARKARRQGKAWLGSTLLGGREFTGF